MHTFAGILLTLMSNNSKTVAKSSNVYIEIDPHKPADRSLKKFKRLCDSYGITKRYRAKKEYKKPSVRKKEKLDQAKKRRQKTNKSPRRGGMFDNNF